MPTLTTQMTKALDTWTPTGCQGELLRADEVNLYYQNKKFYYIGLRKPATLVVGGFTDNNFHKTDWGTTW